MEPKLALKHALKTLGLSEVLSAKESCKHKED